jgi:hypothetical protein
MEDTGTDWPRCPWCNAKRVVRCPICKTAGTDFPEADPVYMGTPHGEEPTEPISCGCGSGGCSSSKDTVDDRPAPPASPVTTHTDDEPAALMLVCTTCDEPFVPEYPRRCEWCGHEFEDGYDVDEQPTFEPLSGRAIAVIVALGVLGIALAVYFVLIV